MSEEPKQRRWTQEEYEAIRRIMKAAKRADWKTGILRTGDAIVEELRAARAEAAKAPR